MRKILKKTLLFSPLYFFLLSVLSFLPFLACSKPSTETKITPVATATATATDYTAINFYREQWHLDSTLHASAKVDLNLQSVWAQGILGDGVTVAIVDDGLEIAHPWIKNHMASNLSSYNFLNQSSDPTPQAASSGHGTAIGGIISSLGEGGDQYALQGIAPRAKLVGLNLLEDFTESHSLAALNYHLSDTATVDISNNSWGNEDSGHFYEADALWNEALWDGLKIGRASKGVLYVVAGGNGGEIEDLSLYDPFSSHIGVMAIAAVDKDGKHYEYSEKGENLWVSAPSGGYSDLRITTTDLVGGLRGFNRDTTTSDYAHKNATKTMNGTSAAAPMVSGVLALMLDANSDLTWRDAKMILALSADKNDPTSSGWSNNGGGIPVHFSYGFGLVNAQEAVARAQGWSLLPNLEEHSVPASGISTEYAITIDNGPIDFIEYVDVSVNLSYPDWGDLKIWLQRDGGNHTSTLATPHSCYSSSGVKQNCTVAGSGFTFGLAHHLDENPNGVWTLHVEIDSAVTNPGALTFNGWKMKIYGH